MPIGSLADLQKHVPSIVKTVNADSQLAMAAAVNPIFAIEELGYQVPHGLRRTIEHRIRFSLHDFERLQKLSAEIHAEFGREFDIESDNELSHALHDKLKSQEVDRLPQSLTLIPRLSWVRSQPDPLEGLRERHHLVKLLVEYRKIEASAPRLATRQLYDEVRSGKTPIPAKSISFQLQRGPTPK